MVVNSQSQFEFWFLVKSTQLETFLSYPIKHFDKIAILDQRLATDSLAIFSVLWVPMLDCQDLGMERGASEIAKQFYSKKVFGL